MSTEKRRSYFAPPLRRLMMIAFLCSFLITSAASATEYVLNAASIEAAMSMVAGTARSMGVVVED